MPRYFFDVSDGDEALDADGRDLPDDEAARRHAMTIAADAAKSDDALDAQEAAVVVTVRGADHRTVAVVSLVMEVTRH